MYPAEAGVHVDSHCGVVVHPEGHRSGHVVILRLLVTYLTRTACTALNRIQYGALELHTKGVRSASGVLVRAPTEGNIRNEAIMVRLSH